MASFIACLGQALSPDGSVAELQHFEVVMEGHGIVMLYLYKRCWLVTRKKGRNVGNPGNIEKILVGGGLVAMNFIVPLILGWECHHPN